MGYREEVRKPYRGRKCKNWLYQNQFPEALYSPISALLSVGTACTGALRDGRLIGCLKAMQTLSDTLEEVRTVEISIVVSTNAGLDQLFPSSAELV